MSHFRVLVAITFFRNVGNVVVESARRKSVAHCEQGVHPICCLADLERKSNLRMILGEVYTLKLPDHTGNFWCGIVASA